MADIRDTSAALDDFNRAPENPLAGPTGVEWAQMVTDGSRPALRLTNSYPSPPWYNGTASNQTSGSIFYSYWTPTIFPAGDIEIWGYPTGGEAGAALTGWRFGFMMANTVPDAGANSLDGYLFLRETALGDFIYFRRYSNNVATDLVPDEGPYTETYKPLLMARRIGDILESWVCSTTDGTGTWTLITRNYGETDWYGPWRLFLGIEDGSHAGTGWDGFGGGVRKATTGYPKIIRRDPRNEFFMPIDHRKAAGIGFTVLGA